MAAEFEKLTEELQARGYNDGARKIRAIIRSLQASSLIPDSLAEIDPVERQLPPFEFDKPDNIPSWIYEIDALNLSTRTRNTLARAGKLTIKELYDSSDAELMRLGQMGKLSIGEIRASLRSFKNKIVSERERLGIEDETPIILPHPTRPIGW